MKTLEFEIRKEFENCFWLSNFNCNNPHPQIVVAPRITRKVAMGLSNDAIINATVGMWQDRDPILGVRLGIIEHEDFKKL